MRGRRDAARGKKPIELDIRLAAQCVEDHAPVRQRLGNEIDQRLDVCGGVQACLDVINPHDTAPQGVELRLNDIVGNVRVEVVRPDEVEFGILVMQQPIHGRLNLLVRRGAGVEHVMRALLTLIVQRVPEHVVVALESRLHGAARLRGPTAEHHGDQLRGIRFSQVTRPCNEHLQLQILAK